MRFIFFILLFCFALYAATPIGTSYLNMQKVSTPSSPASGYMDLYFKDDGAPFYLTSGGTETRIAGAISVGTIDSQTPAANGLVVSGSQIYAQSASASVPGMINTSAQQIAGVKTFVAAPIMSALTASEVVVTNSSKALSSVPYAFPATGSTIPLRDSNGNLVGNVLVRGTATVVSAGGTTSMNGGSAQVQKITGTNFQNFNLPDATTLISGWTYDFNNNSTQNVFIKNNSGSTLVTAVPGSYARAILTDNSTTNGTWDIHWELPTASSFGTGGLTVTGNLLVTGTLTVPTLVATTGITAPYFSSSTSNPSSAGVLRLARTDTVAWRNAANSSNVTLSLDANNVMTSSGNFSASAFISSNTGNPASSGGVRLGNTESVTWRNAANNADLDLTVNSSNQLTYNSNRVFDLGQTLGTQYGGTGQNFSSSTGALVVTSGTVSAMSIAGNTNVVRAPTIQRFTSGSGTYTLPSGPAPLYIKIQMSGGGGGGGGSCNNTADATAGGNGSSTTFGSSLLTAGGGSGGNGVAAGSVSGGNGGTTTINSPATGTGLAGGGGGAGGSYGIAASVTPTGGTGGGFGGGKGIGASSVGADGVANTGGGGSGAGYASAGYAGGGGGAGGYIEAVITNPSSTYAYSVGGGGSAGAGGSGAGSNGGAGGSGYITVTEYYQ